MLSRNSWQSFPFCQVFFPKVQFLFSFTRQENHHILSAYLPPPSLYVYILITSIYMYGSGIYVDIHIHTCIHICTYINTHTHTHTHPYTHRCPQQSQVYLFSRWWHYFEKPRGFIVLLWVLCVLCSIMMESAISQSPINVDPATSVTMSSLVWRITLNRDQI